MKSTVPAQESENERNERIFQSLPRLGSDEYMDLLKRASASELPAPVLVRAYRQLRLGRAAEATLGRLLTNDEKYGYLRPLRKMARRRVSSRDWFDADYLVDQTISELTLALAGPRGEGAHEHWLSFLSHRLEDAYRSLNGRRRERQDPPRADPRPDPETGRWSEPADDADALHAPWHGRVGPSNEEWLEAFIMRTLATIADDRIRQVAQDLFSADPSPISGEAVQGRAPLTERFGFDRYTIYRWRRIARAKLLAALRKQNECEVDLSWLEESASDE